MTIAQWSGIRFGIDAEQALLFSDLKISAETDTEAASENSQAYVTAKEGKPISISMTAILNAALGVDVRSTAAMMSHAAQRGMQAHLYVGGSKIFNCMLMLTKADTEEIAISPTGTWTSCNVKLSFQQCSADWIAGWLSGEAAPEGGDVSSGQWEENPGRESTAIKKVKGIAGNFAKEKEQGEAVQSVENLIQSAKDLVSTVQAAVFGNNDGSLAEKLTANRNGG